MASRNFYKAFIGLLTLVLAAGILLGCKPKQTDIVAGSTIVVSPSPNLSTTLEIPTQRPTKTSTIEPTIIPTLVTNIKSTSGPTEKPMTTNTEDDNATQAPSESNDSGQEKHTVTAHNCADDDNFTLLSWDTDTSSGFKEYDVLISHTNPKPTYPSCSVAKITDRTDTYFSIYEHDFGVENSKKSYYRIAYVQKNGTVSYSNVLYINGPNSRYLPTPTPVTRSGAFLGVYIFDRVRFMWNGVSHPDFSCYKIMYSKTNPNPAYPNDTCIATITDRNTQSLDISRDCFEIGETYYFSVSVVYNDGVILTDKGTAAVVPESTEDPTSDIPKDTVIPYTPEPTPEITPAPTPDPTPGPTDASTTEPTVEPTTEPTAVPTEEPTTVPG